ncbi:pentapeptide repeat-containing protein [Paenibacillus sp. SAF-068]|uniref:pentapeptide repeat-containing protein n=1 Tax=Paenibacillus sp. SAF-068 TaxID=3436864 RepID=UPI003F7F7266
MVDFSPTFIGQLECGEKRGTAFMISDSLALTAYHTLEYYDSEEIKISFPYNENLHVTAKLINKINDVALLSIDGLLQIENSFLLAGEKILPDKEWSTFGYPASREPTGGRFTGKVTLDNLVGDKTYNIDLNVNEGKNGLVFDGLSGAPLIIDNHIVGVITVEKNGKALGATSLSSINALLESNDIAVSKRLIRDEEKFYLNEMMSLKNIKCGDDENLPYQPTVAFWENIESYGDERKLSRPKLQMIEDLIQSFFPLSSKTFHGRLLFTFAEFGKGKSSFYKYAASNLAQKYMYSESDFFPIYVNLKNVAEKWERYAEHKFGCIGGYLEFRYGISLNEDYYKQKTYIFLIDSLDECGEITEENIQKVLFSIERLNLLKPEVSNNNRILISSRPIYLNCIRKALKENAFIPKDSTQKFYLSIYGFLPQQFDMYFRTLFMRQESESIKKNNKMNQRLISLTLSGDSPFRFMAQNSGLKQDELLRPIITYMLYKLIISNVSFSFNNRVSIYLSFLNLLTKEAKYMGDEEIKDKYSLEEELKHRNLLHASAALWMYNQRDNKQGHLKQIDLVRTIYGKNIVNEKDDVLHYRFLSHSYFGNKEDTFYFQHQSFAEMLLAEYYLKILITNSLVKKPEISNARLKLMLGYPTNQTMAFFQGLLELLNLASKDTSADLKIPKKVKKAREMLFPIIASIGLYDTNSTFFNHEIKSSWLSKAEIHSTNYIIPEVLLSEWPINQHVLKKIVNLCIEILSNETKYLLTKARFESSLFDNEVLVIDEDGDFTHHNTDRWIALFTLQEIAKRPYGLRFSDNTINTIVEMIRTHQHMFGVSHPTWSKNLISGLRLNEYSTLSGFDLSDSELTFIKWIYSRLDGVNFSNSRIVISSMSSSNLNGANFQGAELSSVTFRDVECIRSNFDSVLMKGNIFANSELSMSNFDNATCKETDFSDSDISGAKFTYAHLYDNNFYRAHLRNADLRYSTWIDCDLNGVDFQDANLYNMQIDEHSYNRYQEQLSYGKHFDKIKILFSWEVDEILEEIFYY